VVRIVYHTIVDIKGPQVEGTPNQIQDAVHELLGGAVRKRVGEKLQPGNQVTTLVETISIVAGETAGTVGVTT